MILANGNADGGKLFLMTCDNTRDIVIEVAASDRGSLALLGEGNYLYASVKFVI